MRTYFSRRRIIDLVVAGFSSSLLIGISFFSLVEITPNSVDTRLFLTTATIAATLLGFSLASASFLVSHTNSESMKFLRESKSFTQLISLLQSALWRFFGLALLSLLAFVTYEALPIATLAAFVAACTYASLAATCLLWSVAAILGLTS
jgi:hypothetical protein|tara:strand:- start:574 stop:1020 length:447 start_codon:yes stop_codon:yes gene_type:complete